MANNVRYERYERHDKLWTTSEDGLRDGPWRDIVGSVSALYPGARVRDRELYVDFGGEVNLPDGQTVLFDGDDEGWRCLKIMLRQCIDGRYTHGVKPDLKGALAIITRKQNNERLALEISQSAGIALGKPLADIEATESRAKQETRFYGLAFPFSPLAWGDWRFRWASSSSSIMA